MLSIGSLFSGIGGLELGLERAGLGTTTFQCEIDPFCQKVLKKHWPNVKLFSDVRDPNIKRERVDLLCAGFPCQSVSAAGKQEGIKEGTKSGLWLLVPSIINSIKPRIVVIENVYSGKKLWLPMVRNDLRLLGYSSSSYELSAAEVGAPHLRKRIFVVAYAHGTYNQRNWGTFRNKKKLPRTWNYNENWTSSYSDSDIESALRVHAKTSKLCEFSENSRARSVESGIRRVDDGVSNWMDRLKSLGNAVVPQCAEVIGRIIKDQMRDFNCVQS